MKHKPLHVPDNFDTHHYSAMYHTDVLIPSKVMLDGVLDRPRGELQVWPKLDFEYLTAEKPAIDHENFGFVHGTSVTDEAKYQHQWTPWRAPDSIAEELQS
jgi:hypothetical protein